MAPRATHCLENVLVTPGPYGSGVTRVRGSVVGAAPSSRLVAGVVAGIAVALFAAGCHGDAGDPVPAGQATVRSVVDGDTIVVDVGGDDETVRLIGIDTPETKKPNTPIECFGPEASARTHELLPAGTAVRLERDREPRDRYGRLLAYVFRASDGLFIEEALLHDGYADTLEIAPNTAYAERLAEVAAAARAAGAGLWSRCGGNHVATGGG